MLDPWKDENGDWEPMVALNICPYRLRDPNCTIKIPDEYHVTDTYYDEDDEPWVVLEHKEFVSNVVQLRGR